jgi:cohesin loading factor subunit SCC2
MDLVGKHVARDADVAEHYYDVVVERVADVGVSVRKRVINALHDLLRQRTFEFRRPIQALRHLAFRVMDDDPGVRDLVVRIFRELWFSKPPAGQKSDPGAVLDRRAAQLVDVLWAVFSGVSRANVARLPLLPTFPIVAILRRIAFPSEEDLAAAKGPAGGDGGAGELEHAAAFARKMCRAVLDGMLRCEEQEEALEGGEGGEGADEDGAAAMDHDGKDSDPELRYPRSARFALGLHAFCAVDPTLCVSDADPLLFATALQPYVKRREDTPANALRLQCCISVVDAAVSETGALAPSTASDIERDLRFLLLRGMHRGVLAYAARCICSVAETTRGDLKRADVASGALQITRRFANPRGGRRRAWRGDRARRARAARERARPSAASPSRSAPRGASRTAA